MLVEEQSEEIGRITEPITRLTRHPWLMHFRLVDYLTVAYIILVAALIFPFQNRVEYGTLFCLINITVAAFLVWFIHYSGEHPASRMLQILHSSYPLILYTFMFVEISRILTMFFPFWLEKHLIRWDLALFGVYPPVWVQQFFRPWLSEFMAFSYWSYYMMFPLCAVLLYCRKNKQLFHSYVFSLSLTFYACYLAYPFLNARGPHDTLSHLYITRATAGFFDGMVRNVQAGVSISGAAFPSSHVAAAWIVWIYLYKYKSIFGWLTLPLVLSLCVSIVYMQYHYAVDSIAGCIWVMLTYSLARYLERRIAPAAIPLSLRFESGNNEKKA